MENWHFNPDNIETSRVQFWVNGLMMTRVDNAEARRLVRVGRAYVITAQAIGALINGKPMA